MDKDIIQSSQNDEIPETEKKAKPEEESQNI